MAIHKGTRIHQYLDDWLVRAKSQKVCLQHIQTLVKMCLGWLVNLEKSELEPKQVFDFVGYQFDLRSGWVRPTPDWCQTLQEKIQLPLSLPASPVFDRFANSHREASSSRPTTYETHIVSSQNNWRVPESLEKVIPGPCTPTYNGGYRKATFSQASHYTQ